MAEGDSIFRLARRLDGRLAGRTVATSRFAVATLATTDLAGYRLCQVAARGKHLLVRLIPPPPRSGPVRSDLTLHLHLRMDGRLTVRRRIPADLAGSRAGHPDGRRLSFVLVLRPERPGDDPDALVGETVPVVELVRTADEGLVVGHLGPDLCEPGWDDASAGEAARRLAAGPQRPVVEALLDQRNLAGIGNLYAVEGCFLAGLWPWTTVGDLAPQRLARLVDLEHRLLAAGVAGSGQATTGDRRKGHTHWVYGRKDRPCRRCGTLVAFRASDGGPSTRPTWWCPACQPCPSPQQR